MGLSKLCRHVVMSCWNFVCPVTEPHHGAPPYFVYICLSAIPFTIYLDNYYCHQRQAGRPANEWSISLDVYGGQSQMRVFLMGHLQPIFIFWSFRTNITIFTINVNLVLGFEPTTIRSWVSSHNYLTKAPTPSSINDWCELNSCCSVCPFCLLFKFQSNGQGHIFQFRCSPDSITVLDVV